VTVTQARTGTPMWVFLFVDGRCVDVCFAVGMRYLANAPLDIPEYGVGPWGDRHASPHRYAEVVVDGRCVDVCFAIGMRHLANAPHDIEEHS
jgi:hypothetical protein